MKVNMPNNTETQKNKKGDPIKCNSLLWKALFLLVIFTLQMGIVFISPVIGVADNSDFSRSLEPFGLKAVEKERYFHFQTNYMIDSPKTISGYFSDLFNPTELKETGFYSTQFVFTKAALLTNAIYNKVLHRSSAQFDIRILGFIYVLLYSLAVWLLILALIKGKSVMMAVAISVLSIFVLLDSGYLVYINSFYGETPSFILLVLIVGLLLHIIQKEKLSWILVSVLFISIILFSGSKMANLPTALLMLVVLVFDVIRKVVLPSKAISEHSEPSESSEPFESSEPSEPSELSENAKNAVKINTSTFSTVSNIALFFIITISSIYICVAMTKSTPLWMEKVTTYHSVFFGVLKDNPEPKAALEDMELSEELLSLANTNAYIDHSGYQIFGEEFDQLFFKKIGKMDVLNYYIQHPLYFLHKLDKSAEASLSIRPSYLGNFRASDISEKLVFAKRFSCWETLRKQLSGNSLIAYVILGGLFFFLLVWKWIRNKTTKTKNLSEYLLLLFLLFNAAGQFIVPIIGNGEADLMKHMFLFNVSFDLVIIVFLSRLTDVGLFIEKLYQKNMPSINKSIVIALIVVVTSAVILIGIFFNPKTDNNNLAIGSTVFYGTYENIPIEWEVFAMQENTIKLISKNILSLQPYDKDGDNGLNRWAESDIQHWLNSDFLTQAFAQSEQSTLIKQTHKSILASEFTEYKQDGTLPFYWFAMPAYVRENADSAFYENVVDTITLPSVSDIHLLFENGLSIIKKDISGTKKPYWLETPYFSSESMVRVVDPDGFIYHKDANLNAVGVVPIICVEVDVLQTKN